MRVYVAGPYTQGDVAQNVRRAIVAANVLLDRGYAPFVPHLTHFWHLLCPRPYADWLALDLVWLAQCDIVLRLPGPSNGADRECAAARAAGIPVVFEIDALDQR
jgi:hypothetical protein